MNAIKYILLNVLLLTIGSCADETLVQDITNKGNNPATYTFSLCCGVEQLEETRVTYYDEGVYPYELRNRWESSRQHKDEVLAVHLASKTIFKLTIKEIVQLKGQNKNVAIFEAKDVEFEKGLNNGEEIALIFGGHPGDNDIELTTDDRDGGYFHAHLNLRGQYGSLKDLPNRDYMCARSKVVVDSSQKNHITLQAFEPQYEIPITVDNGTPAGTQRTAVELKKLNTLLCFKLFFDEKAFKTNGVVDDGLVAVTLRMPPIKQGEKWVQDNNFYQYFELCLHNTEGNADTPYPIHTAESEAQHNEYLRLNFKELIKPEANGIYQWKTVEGGDGNEHHFIDYDGVTIETAKYNGKQGYLVTCYMAVSSARAIHNYPIVEAFTQDHVYYRSGLTFPAALVENPGNFIPVFVDFSEVEYDTDGLEIEKSMSLDDLEYQESHVGTYCSLAISMLGFDFSMTPGLLYAEKVNSNKEEDVNGSWRWDVYRDQGEWRGDDKQTLTFGEYFVWGSIYPTDCFHLTRPNIEISEGTSVDLDAEWRKAMNNDTGERLNAKRVNDDDYQDVAMRANPIFRTPTEEEFKKMGAEIVNTGTTFGSCLGNYTRKDNSTIRGIYIGTKTQPIKANQDKYLFFPFVYSLTFENDYTYTRLTSPQELVTYLGRYRTNTNETFGLWSRSGNGNNAYRFFLRLVNGVPTLNQNASDTGWMDKRYGRVCRPVIF